MIVTLFLSVSSLSLLIASCTARSMRLSSKYVLVSRRSCAAPPASAAPPTTAAAQPRDGDEECECVFLCHGTSQQASKALRRQSTDGASVPSPIASTSKRHVALARRGCSARNAPAARTSFAHLAALTESTPSP